MFRVRCADCRKRSTRPLEREPADRCIAAWLKENVCCRRRLLDSASRSVHSSSRRTRARKIWPPTVALSISGATLALWLRSPYAVRPLAATALRLLTLY